MDPNLFDVHHVAEEHLLCPALERGTSDGWRSIGCRPCGTSIWTPIDPEVPPIMPIIRRELSGDQTPVPLVAAPPQGVTS